MAAQDPKLVENTDLVSDYSQGNHPAADSLLEHSVLMVLPSSLTRREEDNIIHAFDKVLQALLP